MVNPTISRMQGYMSRFLAVLLFYVLMLAVLVVLGYVLIPNLINQMRELAKALPEFARHSQELLHSPQYTQYVAYVDRGVAAIVNALNGFSQNFVDVTVNLLGNLAIVFTGVVISFYLLLEEKNAREFLHQVLPHDRFKPVYHTVSKISERMGHWGRGQLNLMLVIGVSNLVAFLLLGVHTPLPLAVWAGVCEVLPYIGPFIGLIPAVIVALTTGSVLQALLVILVSLVVIQQLEAHIVVPRIMSKAVGLSPVLVILALLVGAKLFGIAGAILGVPIAAVISVIVGEWPQLRTLWENGAGDEDDEK